MIYLIGSNLIMNFLNMESNPYFSRKNKPFYQKQNTAEIIDGARKSGSQ